MKEVTEAALEHILLAHPQAKVETRDGSKIVRIPMYDHNTDKSYFVERKVVSSPDVTPMGILPVFNLRKGPNFNPDGEAKTSPLGKLYRIIGYSPPPKDSDE